MPDLHKLAEKAEQAERRARLPDGANERFAGYGIMGLPFNSGHVLGLRRFPASSVGPGYTSMWHRNLVLNGDGYRALQCPECGHVDDLLWLSEEARLLLWEKTIRRHESSSEEQRVA